MKTNNLLYGVLVIVVMFITAAITHLYDRNKCSEVQDLTEQTDSVNLQQEPYSVGDYLEYRNIIREQERINKVFLNLEDVVLIDILETFGTDLSIDQIVNIYESNKEIYDKVTTGAKIQQKIQNKEILNFSNKEESIQNTDTKTEV